MSITRLDANPRRSMGIVHNGTVYLGGLTPDDATVGTAGIEEQTRDVLAKVDALLARAGTDKRRLLLVTGLLKNLSDWPGFNTVWDAWVDKDSPPCRCSFGDAAIGGPAPGYLIEIVAIAAV